MQEFTWADTTLGAATAASHYLQFARYLRRRYDQRGADHGGVDEHIVTAGEWTDLPLFIGCRKDYGHCQLCPRTAAAIASQPELNECVLGSNWLSRLGAGTHLKAHCAQPRRTAVCARKRGQAWAPVGSTARLTCLWGWHGRLFVSRAVTLSRARWRRAIFCAPDGTGTRAAPRTVAGGPSNLKLRIHMGVVVPPGCRIRVADEWHTWREGECLVFDESFEHEVHAAHSLRAPHTHAPHTCTPTQQPWHTCACHHPPLSAPPNVYPSFVLTCRWCTRGVANAWC